MICLAGGHDTYEPVTVALSPGEFNTQTSREDALAYTVQPIKLSSARLPSIHQKNCYNLSSFHPESALTDQKHQKAVNEISSLPNRDINDTDAFSTLASDLTKDGDDCSTTSGSYVVDPEELCNEIENLFFSKVS